METEAEEKRLNIERQRIALIDPQNKFDKDSYDDMLKKLVTTILTAEITRVESIKKLEQELALER